MLGLVAVVTLVRLPVSVASHNDLAKNYNLKKTAKFFMLTGFAFYPNGAPPTTTRRLESLFAKNPPPFVKKVSESKK